MDKSNRRLSIGDALKKGAAAMDVNDDEAERAARRKSRVEVGTLPKASTISAEKLGKKDVWNVPVTDMLAKEGQSETVDFRDASLTIDASAHVYSKRVEEVLTKTTTLAGGLASEDLESFAQEQEENPAKVEDEEELDSKEKEEKQEKRRRVSNRGANTLETNEASLTMKRNEREYAIDPLFHKRSAIFDSGGAKGLLLNVLSVHNGYELVFDAADLVDDSAGPTLHVAGGEVEDELRKMVQGLLPHNWQESEICPEYAERRKGSSVAMQLLLEQMPDEESIETTTNRMDEDSDYNHEDNMMDMGPRVTMEPRKEGNQEDDDGMIVSFGGGQQRPDGEQSTYNAAAHNAAWDYVDNDQSDDGGDEYRGTEETLLDARLQRIEQQEQETEILIQPNMELYEVADGPNAEYTYFNRDKLANWAGPEHWKHKMKPNKKHQGEDEEYQDEEGNIVKSAPAKSRGPRKAFKIDFTAPPPANLADLLQAGGSSTILPKPTLDKQLRDARMLMIPPDINYDVANFGATFLPHHVVVARNRKAEVEARLADNGMDVEMGAMAGGPDDDDNDDYHFDNMLDYGERAPYVAPAVTGSTAIALRPGDEGYLPNVARIDKRVDVKALKSTIWRELCTATDSTDSTAAPETTSAVMKAEKPFQEVLEVLPQFMAPEVVKDVSVSYCFVCLLHLANEKGLAIRQENLDTLFVRQGTPTSKPKGRM